jgi:hypothetical protein
MWHLFLLKQDANQLMYIYFGITAAMLHLAAHQSTGFTPLPDCHGTPLRFRRQHRRTRCNAATLLDPSSLLDPIVQHPATKALTVDVRPRSRLKRLHRHLSD